ncbi:hypothetical protein SmJEL517_g01682 [Synchytrium microbalum]|uniref:t-SNARE coiled-coil homology domain-containing protein n=1 Tax=Synchytrium microbalum TaxID=1806994 RepID=A0A507C8L1_9FUNG|nr:uncharacterized protein SmJEL517_g01682 [Synchytrium microbalum]TPX35962.1 hypothetical protein SmJEL517_g01682 [Synchytrium microbalum]
MSRYSSNSQPQSRNSRQDSAKYIEEPAYESNRASKWSAAADKATGGGGFQRGAEALYDEQDDYEDLQVRTRDIQQESLSSTRRALMRVRETEVVAQSNLSKVSAQGEQLNHIERKLDLADQKAFEADAKTNELKKLNRPFFLPTWGAKSARNENGIASRDAQRQDRDKARDESNQQRNDRMQRVMDAQASMGPRGGSSYSTPAGVERDDTEEEIDVNLDQISGGLSRLKFMASAMNEEIDGQNGSFTRITTQADKVQARVDNTHKKVQKFLPKNQRS